MTSSNRGRHECGGFAEAQPRTKEKRSREQKPPLSGRGEKPVSDDSRRWNGAQWKSQPLERFTGGAGMERSGAGLNWRSQAPKAADVSLKAAFGDSSAVLTLHVSNRDTIHPFMQNASP